MDLMGVGPSNRNVVPEGVDCVEVIDGIRVCSSTPTDIMFRELYVNGLYQDDVLAALDHLVEPGSVFWDIGANYGFMSIYVHRARRGDVSITAFDPNPVILPELERNLSLNGCENVRIESTCLSDTVGEVVFYTSSDHSWNATMVPVFAERHAENVEVRVPSTTIDRYVESNPPPDVIKLDVEGAEHLVIEGGRGFLAEAKTAIVVEYNLDSIVDAGLTGEGYLESFRALGYRIEILDRPAFGRYRWDRRSPVNAAAALPKLCNLVLTKH